MIPNSPSRRAHILQAHALRARGYTIEQIAEQTKHAPSTVHAWLRDLDDHRQQFVALFAQDQLLVLLHSHAEMLRVNELNPPKDTDEAGYRNQQLQSYAAISRELRMVCTQLSRTSGEIIGMPDDPPMSVEEVDAISQAATLREQLSDFLQPPPAPAAAETAEITQTELEVSESPETESPVQDKESADSTPEKSVPQSEPPEEPDPFADPNQPLVRAARHNAAARHLLQQSRNYHRSKHKTIPTRNGNAATEAGKPRNLAERRARHPQSAPPPGNQN